MSQGKERISSPAKLTQRSEIYPATQQSREINDARQRRPRGPRLRKQIDVSGFAFPAQKTCALKVWCARAWVVLETRYGEEDRHAKNFDVCAGYGLCRNERAAGPARCVAAPDAERRGATSERCCVSRWSLFGKACTCGKPTDASADRKMGDRERPRVLRRRLSARIR